MLGRLVAAGPAGRRRASRTSCSRSAVRSLPSAIADLDDGRSAGSSSGDVQPRLVEPGRRAPGPRGAVELDRGRRSRRSSGVDERSPRRPRRPRSGAAASIAKPVSLPSAIAASRSCSCSDVAAGQAISTTDRRPSRRSSCALVLAASPPRIAASARPRPRGRRSASGRRRAPVPIPPSARSVDALEPDPRPLGTRAGSSDRARRSIVAVAQRPMPSSVRPIRTIGAPTVADSTGRSSVGERTPRPQPGPTADRPATVASSAEEPSDVGPEYSRWPLVERQRAGAGDRPAR